LISEALLNAGDRSAVEILLLNLPGQSGFPLQSVVAALAVFRDPRAVGPMIEIFETPTVYKRPIARALGKLGDPRAIEPLSRHLGINDFAVRLEIIDALKAIRDPAAVSSVEMRFAEVAKTNTNAQHLWLRGDHLPAKELARYPRQFLEGATELDELALCLRVLGGTTGPISRPDFKSRTSFFFRVYSGV
jgi:HEAT repeat protein